MQLLNNKSMYISHPLVESVYLKTQYGGPFEKSREDTLVILSKLNDKDGHSDTFRSYLDELLCDLPDIQLKAYANLGPFDRVDIKFSS